jgi:hypothetical protein
MAEETRTRFAWTWAGVLAGVVLVGASYGPNPPPADRAAPAREAQGFQLAQLDPTSPAPGMTPTPGTTPVPGSTPMPGTMPSPVFTDTDAGVGGSGYVPPPLPVLGGDADAGVGSPAIPSVPGVGPGVGGSGLPGPAVGGTDGGVGF